MREAATALEQTPPSSPLRTMMDDYQRLRAQVRTCEQGYGS